MIAAVSAASPGHLSRVTANSSKNVFARLNLYLMTKRPVPPKTPGHEASYWQRVFDPKDLVPEQQDLYQRVGTSNRKLYLRDNKGETNDDQPRTDDPLRETR